MERDRSINRQTSRHTERKTGMLVHRQVGRKQADIHMGGRTDRQTDIHTRARAQRQTTDSRQTHRQQTDINTVWRTGRQEAGKHTDWRKDRPTDRETDSRQTDSWV